jgi:hypothetical protein
MSLRFGRGPAAAVVLGGCLFASAPAFGLFTTVNGPAPGEKSIKEILDHVYGGSFVPAGVNYSNGTKTAVRINDTPEPGARGPLQPLNLIYDPNTLNTGLMPTDQVREADAEDAKAEARFAVFTQEFGFAEGTAAVNYQHLLFVNGSGFSQNDTATLSNMSNRIWRWARSGENGTFTSQNSDNPSGVDHMITYRIDSPTGLNVGAATTTYLLFFEYLKPNQNPDMDFNDMVVEIKATQTQVPEPASTFGLLGLSGLLLRRKRD